MEEVENNPTYSGEQRQLYRDRLDELNTEKPARLEILSQNGKDFQPQLARIKKTLEKFLIKVRPWQEELVPYFVKTGHNHIFNTDYPFNDYFNDCLCYYRCFWGRQRDRRFSTKR